MYAVSQQFLQAVRDPRGVLFQCDVYTAGVKILSNLPIASGSVTVDESSDSRRTASFVVSDPTLKPWGTGDLLAPYGNDVVIYSGIDYGNGATELIPVFTGRIDAADWTMAGAGISISAVDWVAKIKDAAFSITQASLPSTSIISQIKSLIIGGYSSAVIIDQTNDKTLTSATPIAFDDRWPAVTQLATSIGAEVFCDAAGNFIIRYVPANSGVGYPVFTVDVGVRGVLIDADRSMTRDNVYNRVIVLGDQTGAASPISYTVSDTDPNSPTRFGGPFGNVIYTVTSPLVTTTAQAKAMATGILARHTGLAFSVNLTMVPNVALEPGDLILVSYGSGQNELHIISSLAIDFGTGAMTASTRTNKPASS